MTSEPAIADFRDAMAAFPAGVTVVTGRDEEELRGFTATSVVPFSDRPPSLLVCVEKTGYSHESMTRGAHFAVNLLADGQEDLALLFASKRPDKFEQVAWRTSEHGVPLLEATLGYAVCRRELVADHGDHSIVVGRIVAAALDDRRPLVYWRRSFHDRLG